jgi:hypothetical protein
MSTQSRRWVAPALVGAVAVAVAGWLLWLTFKGDAAPAPVAPKVTTSVLVDKAGGYRLDVPAGMKATRNGQVTKIVDQGHTIDVTVTPSRAGRPAATNTRVLARMGSTYQEVDLIASERQQVDGRPAAITIGKGVTKEGVKVRFVLVTVKGDKSRNYSISTFTAADSDPNVVLPQVRAIANGFHVLPKN